MPRLDHLLSVVQIRRTTRKVRRGQQGFTLIELVIVMAIIALLAALVGPQLFGQLEGSKGKATKAQIEMLSTAFDSYRLDNGRYPKQEEGLDALVTRPSTLATWAGPYLRKKELPKDGWGNSFVYEIPAKRATVGYDLYSLGADGKPGGEGDNADFGNW